MASIKSIGVSHFQHGTLTEPSEPCSIPLKGFSAIYLSKTLSQITFKREEPTLFTIRPGIYGIVRNGKSSFLFQPPRESNFLTLIPRRNLTKKDNNTSQTSFQNSPLRFVLIIYNPFKDVHKRQSVSRLMQRTPLIRIKPGVVLAPQIRAARFRSYHKGLLRPSEFVQKLIELGSPVWYASRLEVSHRPSEDVIGNLVRETFEVSVKRILDASRQLYRKIGHIPEKESIPYYKKRFLGIRNRLRYVREKAIFFKNELGIDVQYMVARGISAISRVRQRIKLCDN